MKRFKQAIGLFMMALALMAALPWINPMAITTHHMLLH